MVANSATPALSFATWAQLVHAAGAEKAEEMLKRAETGFKENYKLLTELAALPQM